MKLNRIEQIYRGLKNDNETYYIFNYSKNGVIFNILFDIYYSPFKLHFLVVKDNFSFVIDINKGFIISTSLNKEDYIRLCRVLGLKYDEDNPFSPKIFFEDFDKNIPLYNKRKHNKRELYKFYCNSIEESNKIYYKGILPWKEINNGKNVTQENLEKTRILYPELYDFCKRENVSIIYTANKSEENEISIFLQTNIKNQIN